MQSVRGISAALVGWVVLHTGVAIAGDAESTAKSSTESSTDHKFVPGKHGKRPRYRELLDSGGNSGANAGSATFQKKGKPFRERLRKRFGERLISTNKMPDNTAGSFGGRSLSGAVIPQENGVNASHNSGGSSSSSFGSDLNSSASGTKKNPPPEFDAKGNSNPEKPHAAGMFGNEDFVRKLREHNLIKEHVDE
jgi:hypothetical protein